MDILTNCPHVSRVTFDDTQESSQIEDGRNLVFVPGFADEADEEPYLPTRNAYDR